MTASLWLILTPHLGHWVALYGTNDHHAGTVRKLNLHADGSAAVTFTDDITVTLHPLRTAR